MTKERNPILKELSDFLTILIASAVFSEDFFKDNQKDIPISFEILPDRMGRIGKLGRIKQFLEKFKSLVDEEKIYFHCLIDKTETDDQKADNEVQCNTLLSFDGCVAMIMDIVFIQTIYKDISKYISTKNLQNEIEVINQVNKLTTMLQRISFILTTFNKHYYKETDHFANPLYYLTKLMLDISEDATSKNDAGVLEKSNMCYSGSKNLRGNFFSQNKFTIQENLSFTSTCCGGKWEIPRIPNLEGLTKYVKRRMVKGLTCKGPSVDMLMWLTKQATDTEPLDYIECNPYTREIQLVLGTFASKIPKDNLEKFEEKLKRSTCALPSPIPSLPDNFEQLPQKSSLDEEPPSLPTSPPPSLPTSPPPKGPPMPTAPLPTKPTPPPIPPKLLKRQAGTKNLRS